MGNGTYKKSLGVNWVCDYFFYLHIHSLTKYLLNLHDVPRTVLYAEEENI